MFKSEAAGKAFEIEFGKQVSEGKINQQDFAWDILKTGPSSFNILRNNRSFNVIVESFDPESNLFQLKVNGKLINVKTLDRMQILLQSMGLDTTVGRKLNEIKAPMPGLVVRITVEEGAQVKKGDSLLVLEAMKMENVIKAPGDAVVGKIKVNAGQAVEKNQLLISFV
jgi:biotin carboxyl carrier protein